jgi:hypothetical protein
MVPWGFFIFPDFKLVMKIWWFDDIITIKKIEGYTCWVQYTWLL